MSKREIEDGECSDEEEPEAKKIRTEEFEGDFVIDANVSEIVENEEGDIDEEKESSPSKWAELMKNSLLGETKPEEKSAKRGRRKQNCFNCGGDHMITHCKEPKDFKRIKMAKMEHHSQQQAMSSRYHDDGTKEAKYKAGRLSSSLREALAIGPDDIPEWIYRMRRMGFYKGYPPGYLKRALKIDNSETLLKFHTSSNNIVTKQEESNGIRPPPTLDTSKVIYYMGFNNSYRALRDMEQFRVPPFELFCEMLQKEVSYEHDNKERKRLREETQNVKSADVDEVQCDFVIDKEKSEPVEVCEEKLDEQQDADDSSMGDSISHHVGTPIICRRGVAGEMVRESLPDLDKFSVGIVPFEAKEEHTGERGIFKRIMGKIKDFSTGK